METKVDKDYIANRFNRLESIGQGKQAKVFNCLDREKKEHVALKVIQIKDSFDIEDLLNEVKMLELLKKMDEKRTANIVHMKEHFYVEEELYITFDLMGDNLLMIMKKNIDMGFSNTQMRACAVDLLQCLLMLKKAGIIHGDLKPENMVLCPKDHKFKVIDFVGCRFENDKYYPYYTPFYTSPEMQLLNGFSTAADMWSLGCILAEMDIGFPLFMGSDEPDQFSAIVEVLGAPPEEFLLTAPKKQVDYILSSGSSVRVPNSKDLDRILTLKDEDFLDFIQRCLKYIPEERMTPEEAMKHPWILKGLHPKGLPKIPASLKAFFSGKKSLPKNEKMKVPEMFKSSSPGNGKVNVQKENQQDNAQFQLRAQHLNRNKVSKKLYSFKAKKEAHLQEPDRLQSKKGLLACNIMKDARFQTVEAEKEAHHQELVGLCNEMAPSGDELARELKALKAEKEAFSQELMSFRIEKASSADEIARQLKALKAEREAHHHEIMCFHIKKELSANKLASQLKALKVERKNHHQELVSFRIEKASSADELARQLKALKAETEAHHQELVSFHIEKASSADELASQHKALKAEKLAHQQELEIFHIEALNFDELARQIKALNAEKKADCQELEEQVIINTVLEAEMDTLCQALEEKAINNKALKADMEVLKVLNQKIFNQTINIKASQVEKETVKYHTKETKKPSYLKRLIKFLKPKNKKMEQGIIIKDLIAENNVLCQEPEEQAIKFKVLEAENEALCQKLEEESIKFKALEADMEDLCQELEEQAIKFKALEKEMEALENQKMADQYINIKDSQVETEALKCDTRETKKPSYFKKKKKKKEGAHSSSGSNCS